MFRLFLLCAIAFSSAAFAKAPKLSELETQFAVIAAESESYRKTCEAYCEELNRLTGTGQASFTPYADRVKGIALLEKIEKGPQPPQNLRGAAQLFLDHEAEILKWKDLKKLTMSLRASCSTAKVYVITSSLLEGAHRMSFSSDETDRLKMVVIDSIRAELASPSPLLYSRVSIGKLEKLEEFEVVRLKREQKKELSQLKNELLTMQKKLDKEFDLVMTDERKATAQIAKEFRELTPLRLKIRDFATAL